jgi:N-acetyl-anhydromuramyl-L-alanine amidase AmpD
MGLHFLGGESEDPEPAAMHLQHYYNRRDFLEVAVKVAALAAVQGCTTVTPQPRVPGAAPRSQAPPGKARTSSTKVRAPEGCIIHEVAPMETVPRLAQMYGVSEESILRANRLGPKDSIEPGMPLIISHPTRYKNIVPVFENRRWQYIIIHHTAGEAGKALLVDQMHRDRGFELGLGYHFLVDNGTLGKGDGQLEVAPRWIQQQEGAHCKAADMNSKAIGISVVGNCNSEPPSRAQLHTLTQLVGTLGSYYRIPLSHVLAHCQVPGAATDCPGKLFPWKSFHAGLKKTYASSLCQAQSAAPAARAR